MDGSPGSSVVSDAPTTSEYDDVTFEALKSKCERMKQLLIKQSNHSKGLKNRQEELEKVLETAQLKIAELQGRLGRASKYEPPKDEDVYDITARVRVENDIYACYKTKRGLY